MPTKEELEEQQRQEAEQARQKELATLVNSVVATHLKGVTKKLGEELLTSVNGSLKESLGPMIAEALKAHAPTGGEPPKGAPGAEAGKPSPEVAALQKQLTDITKAQQDAIKRAEESERNAWNEKAYAGLQGLLQGKIRPELLGVVTDHLFKVKQSVVKHDADGSPLFKVKQSPMAGMPEQEQVMPLADGIDLWLRSKEAAPFVPPPDPKRRPGQPVPARTVEAPTFDKPATSSNEKNRRAMIREKALAEQFPNLAR